MSYHHCPIEPNDWRDGPYEQQGEECHTCEGTGEIVADDDTERTCPSCGGSGYVEREPYEDDYHWED